MTARCLTDDLGLGQEYLSQDVREYSHQLEVLRKFASVRGTDPSSGEVLSGFPAGCRSLHVGRPRAVTYWDPDEDVCWLLAYAEYHAVGDRKDAFNVFQDLNRRGELTPTVDDYLALNEELTEDFLEQLGELGEGLLDEARAHPGTEAVDSLYRDDGRASIVIDVVVFPSEGSQLEQGWLGVTLPQGSPWPTTDVYTVALALVGGELDLLPADNVGKRPRRRNEVAFTWDSEVELPPV